LKKKKPDRIQWQRVGGSGRAAAEGFSPRRRAPGSSAAARPALARVAARPLDRTRVNEYFKNRKFLPKKKESFFKIRVFRNFCCALHN